jgi:hypothetical protein
MERNDAVTQLVYAAIDEVNSTLSPEQALKKSPDTVIIGVTGSLDSVGVVNFVIAVEDGIERKFRETINLMDAMIAANTEWTVAAVGKCIEEQLHRLQGERGLASGSTAPSTLVQ